ncbi:MAG TPA: hypothetical protein VGO49_09945 [Bradyrhizobium sp.]|jgi:hypothetical protein|nr:hypothetical protein [Bradyrhizobium sp.]
MASRPVSARYLKAGAVYLESLRALGLNPNFLGWGWDIAAERWILVLVTSIIDAGGPLALNRLLFRAYNAEATPKDISPFIVRVFSSAIVENDFYMLGEKQLTFKTVNGKKGDPIKIANVQRTFSGIELEQINSYQNLPNRKLKYHERRQAWQKFKNNVERLAA